MHRRAHLVLCDGHRPAEAVNGAGRLLADAHYARLVEENVTFIAERIMERSEAHHRALAFFAHSSHAFIHAHRRSKKPPALALNPQRLVRATKENAGTAGDIIVTY